MTKIQSKVHNYGHENESSWPSQYGTGDKTPMYIDPVTNELKEGYPPLPAYHDKAPLVIFDSMPAQYHEGACRVIESRREWDRADKEHDCLTFGSKKDAAPIRDEARERKKKKEELRKASKTALDVYRANPKEVRDRLQKQSEEQIETLKKAGLTKQLKEAGVRYE